MFSQLTNKEKPLQRAKRNSLFFQPKLAVNQPNDMYEQQADAVADKVMRMPATPLGPVVHDKHFFHHTIVNPRNTITEKEDPLKKEDKEKTGEAIPGIQAKLSFDTLPPPPDNNKTNNATIIQRKCAHCEEEEKQTQRKEMNSNTVAPDSSTENYINSLDGKGRSLTGEERNFFEPRMNYDFSDVQLHTNSEANESAKSINALAYTHSNNIVFGTNNYQPGTAEGKKLMAHELTHVMQQADGVHTKIIQREEAVSEHSTGGMNYTSAVQLDKYKDVSTGAQLSGYNYWYQKINSVYKLEYQTNTNLFSQLDANNINIFLAKAWELQPAATPSAANPATTNQAAFLPARVGVTASSSGKPYLFYCTFNYSFPKGSTKPLLQMLIIDAIAQTAPPVNVSGKISGIKKVPDEINKTLDKATSFNFPAKDLTAYFKAHPEVRESVGKYAQWRFEEYKKSKAKDDLNVQEIISTSEVNGGKAENIVLMISMTINRDAGVNFITLHYSQEKNNKVTAGIDQKDYIDSLIEKYDQEHPGATDKLGTIDGLDKITDTNERVIVKAVAYDLYANEFDKAGVKQKSFRDTEVDQIIPVTSDPANAAKTELYYYTFIVHKADANNVVNISVRRIGKKGDAVVGDPSEALITRVPGYAENAFDANNAETPAKLIKWILSIYKGVKEADIKAATVADITTNINKLIETKSGAPDWFKKNYSINVLDAAKGAARLKSIHNVPDAERVGVKDYTADELKLLELVLERFGKILLAKLAGVYFIRQEKNLSAAFGWVSGLTQQPYTYTLSTKVISDVQKTITIYDGAFGHDNIFFGGSEGINAGNIEVLTHEIGHAEGGPRVGIKTTDPTYQDVFNKFYKGLGLVPVTSYAKDTSHPAHSPESEYFPEAFMLFMDDPEWLLNNQYQTYFWFLFLQQKGTAPSDDQVKSLINIWEKQKAVAGSATSVTTAREVYYLWAEYAMQKKKLPDDDNTATMLSVITGFETAKSRSIRMDEASGIVTKWLAFVIKNKKQPSTDEIKTFFP
jgi:uncharacterized protein DUF4157